MTAEFVHLHNHTDYSLLDGAQTVPTLLETIDGLGMDTVAVTEHGNMFSAIHFYKSAKSAGIRPIIGCEAYVAQGDRFDKTPRPGGGWGNNHLVLLAQNAAGYHNLIKLVTAGHLEGFYYRPRVDKPLLREHSEGLVCLSACLKGEIQEKLSGGDWEGAKAAALEFAEIFPGRFYLELQNHGIAEEDHVRGEVAKLARELSLPLVATNDCHYARPEDAQAHDIMFCLGTGKGRDDPKRQRYATPEFYFKSQDQMWSLFHDYPAALENTRRIAEECRLDISLGTPLLPHFPIPPDAGVEDPNLYLASLCRKGLGRLFPNPSPELQERLDFELNVIRKMGFAGYFLIVMDFVAYARARGIPVGPGRGSVAGSLVAYTLGITTIDPIHHNLLFERFLNPERISLPDIDIDFCYERRGEVIEYIRQKYGERSVSQIITFGKLKARQVVRDVGRVLGLNYGEVDRIAKIIPAGPGVTLQAALEISPDLQATARQDDLHRELIEYSRTLEGMNRHASTHAAGVVIAPGDLTDYVPLYQTQQGDVTTQYDMKDLESLGLLKMDFLGLRNLTVIDQTVTLLRERGIRVTIEKIPLDDPAVYRLFSRGDTVAIFQFESSGMRDYLKKLKPTCIEDLIAMNALYRPGPMENIEEFIKRKHGRKKIAYIHPDLEPILKETHGIIVYQEQVMQIAHQIAGFSLAQADLMRRAMGKKSHDLMQAQGEAFVTGAIRRDMPEKVAKEIFDLLQKFAQYGFNKSHSTAYAYVAYQTAYLKAHYPAEFMAANLTSEMGGIPRVVTLLSECRKMKLTVHPPDIQESDIHFKALDDKTIAFGLNAIKNVGTKALESVLEARQQVGRFSDLFAFCERVDLRLVNKKVIESLIAAGAMDSLPGRRAQKYTAVEAALRHAQQIRTMEDSSQFSLFGGGGGPLRHRPSLPDLAEWPEAEKLEREKEVIGFYLTGHPLLDYASELERFSNYDFSEVMGDLEAREIRIGGMVQDVRIHFDRKNQQMAFVTLECLGGKAEVLLFHDPYVKHKSLLEEKRLVFVKGRPSQRGDETVLKLVAEELLSLDEVRARHVRSVHIALDLDTLKPEEVDSLHAFLKEHAGRSPLVLHLRAGDGNGQRLVSDAVHISSSKELITQLQARYGDENVWVE